MIQQIFAQVEVISPHVAKGHYDLIGPNGEIILPQVWETAIEPGWAITMSMWPMPQHPREPPPPAHRLPGQGRMKPGRDVGSDREDPDSGDSALDFEIEDCFEMGIEFEKEAEKAKLSLGELLGRFTNATYTVAEMDAGSTTGSDTDSLIGD